MARPTPAQIIALHKRLEVIHDCEFVSKSDSRWMDLAGKGLAVLGIQTEEEFEGYTTTIGRTIFIAYEIGVESPGYPLEWQAKVAIHETVHVGQWRRGGWVGFGLGYLVNKLELARWEGQAYASEYDIEYWRTGAVPELSQNMDQLYHYGLDGGHVAVAHTISKQLGLAVANDVPSSPEAAIGVQVLQEIMPEWRQAA